MHHELRYRSEPLREYKHSIMFRWEIRISTLEPDGTSFQVHLLIDGKLETIDTVSVGGYIPFTPAITIYSIPFWVTIGTSKMRIVPHPTNTPPDNIIINL